MVIYLDLVVMSVLGVNSLIIESISSLFKERISIIRLILSNIFAVGFQLIFLFPICNNTVFRFLLGIPLGIISFRSKEFKRKTIQIILYYLLNLCFIGSLIAFNVKTPLVFILTLLLTICMFVLSTFVQKNEAYVQIHNNNLLSLIDSGNELYFNEVPICVISKKWINEQFSKIGVINVQTINSYSIENVYNGPPIKFKKRTYKVCYIISKNDMSYDLILNKEIGESQCLNF